MSETRQVNERHDGARGAQWHRIPRARHGATPGAWAMAISVALLMAGCGRTEPAAAPAAGTVATPASAPATAAPAAPIASVEADPLAAMQHLAGVDCSRAASGIQTCTASGYDISGIDRACAEDDTGFGAVLDDAGATLLDRFPADGATEVASVPKGQFLCVQFVAEASAGGDAWAYVTAIPPALVERCEGNTACGDAPFAPAWSGEAPQGACGIGEEGRYTTACPAGWVRRAAIDEYSMGLGGTG